MERLQLGSISKGSNQTLTWKDALSQGILQGTWVLRYLFLPQRFPNGAFIIENEVGVRVKKSISSDMVKEIARFLSLSKTKIAEVKGLLVFDEDGNYYMEKEKADEGYGYVFTGSYFVYKHITDTDILSEDF